MAYNDSGELPASQSTYSLGGYTFELKVQTVHEPGEEDVVSVYAICRGPDGTRETQAVDYPEGTTVKSWSVENNETEATVYATVAITSEQEIISADGVEFDGGVSSSVVLTYGESAMIGEVRIRVDGNAYDQWERADFPNGRTFSVVSAYNDMPWTIRFEVINSRIYLTKYHDSTFRRRDDVTSYFSHIERKTEEEEALIARFEIDIREADTEDWDEPGNDGPPGTTLNVTVTGATAGSCTGTPADNETVKGYGDGGDGGYGGGGGAGASTVIIYEFATSIADSVQQEAISRGPGTGGPGGKGGKGGDGCILIFY